MLLMFRHMEACEDKCPEEERRVIQEEDNPAECTLVRDRPEETAQGSIRRLDPRGRDAHEDGWQYREPKDFPALRTLDDVMQISERAPALRARARCICGA